MDSHDALACGLRAARARGCSREEKLAFVILRGSTRIDLLLLFGDVVRCR